MQFTLVKNTFFLLVLFLLPCGNETGEVHSVGPVSANETATILPGADQPKEYLSKLKGVKVGLVANQTSVVHTQNKHLADFLLDNKVELLRVFAPEHGFRGKADAGELVKDGVDLKTGLPIISLYGKNKKPDPAQLKGIELMVFDIQDVGARFYTYISSLHYIMEACAENNIPLLVLDRPNPNGHYVDGPVLDVGFKSFVGMHSIPVVHGMTIGEYARMINGEGWLEGGAKCKLEVVAVANYDRNMDYHVPIRPSPNLPNDRSINLYPSLCFFEGTIISAGRGTDWQFQVFGAPELPAENYPYTFTPHPNEGSGSPKFSGKACHGLDLRQTPDLQQLDLTWLIEAYKRYPCKEKFFNSFFEKLAGNSQLQKQIEQGLNMREIRESWQDDLAAFKQIRKKYLIYN